MGGFVENLPTFRESKFLRQSSQEMISPLHQERPPHYTHSDKKVRVIPSLLLPFPVPLFIEHVLNNHLQSYTCCIQRMYVAVVVRRQYRR